jgi:hypothetical protein
LIVKHSGSDKVFEVFFNDFERRQLDELHIWLQDNCSGYTLSKILPTAREGNRRQTIWMDRASALMFKLTWVNVPR